jgi:hypothetical protein
VRSFNLLPETMSDLGIPGLAYAKEMPLRRGQHLPRVPEDTINIASGLDGIPRIVLPNYLSSRYTMFSLLLLIVFGGAAMPSLAWQQQCQELTADLTTSVRDVSTHYYPVRSFINVTSPWSTLTTTNLPAFCRLIFNVLTNPVTGKTAGAELWLPDDWNTRMLAFEGGGWSGGGLCILVLVVDANNGIVLLD